MTSSMSSEPPPSLQALVARFDERAFELPDRPARVRLSVGGSRAWDVMLAAGQPRRLVPASDRDPPAAELRADEGTWVEMARDLRHGMRAFREGRLRVRRNLHLGVGFLAATGGPQEPGRLRFRQVGTSAGSLSILEAGQGDPVVMLHGLGATKASFLPTVAALAGAHRAIALDLPGFGDSDKPIGAPYDAAFFARSVIALLDALGLERAHVIGNSMGGRAALEVGLLAPTRVGRIALLSTSLAWIRPRPWAPYLRLVRPELGLLQPAPRPVVELVVRRLIPGATRGWTAAGVDEFLRAYMTPRGRAAFYAAARQIYLEEPDGDRGFWPRLRALEPATLFVWGRRDPLVPLAFARHVEEALPAARHVELDCGHVPQLERPSDTHRAIRRFFAEAPLSATRRKRKVA